MKKFGKRTGGAILTLAFVFGISAATGFTAQAQTRNDDGNYQRRHRDGDDKKDQQRHWERNRNRDVNQAESRDWRRNRDWNRDRRDRRYDNNGSYGRNNGRNRSYGNSGGYNNSNQIELNQGYQAGLNTGASDAQRGQSFNPQRSHYYRNASSQAFRQGFVQGYDQGYRQYSGYGNGRNRTSDGGFGSILGGILGRP